MSGLSLAVAALTVVVVVLTVAVVWLVCRQNVLYAAVGVFVQAAEERRLEREAECLEPRGAS